MDFTEVKIKRSDLDSVPDEYLGSVVRMILRDAKHNVAVVWLEDGSNTPPWRDKKNYNRNGTGR